MRNINLFKELSKSPWIFFLLVFPEPFCLMVALFLILEIVLLENKNGKHLKTQPFEDVVYW